MAGNPELRTRVETARQLGISLRTFDGWTPERETVYEYDDDGRLVRSREWVAAEWDETQRAWMLALADYEQSRCTGCGGDVNETFDPANDGAWMAEAWRCHRCTSIDDGADAYANAGGKITHALRFIPERIKR